MTERAWKWLGGMFAVGATLWLVGFAGCLVNRLNDMHDQTTTVTGTITKITREWKYEAPCGVLAGIRGQCDEIPTCCAYTVTITDSTGHKTYAVAWWPKHAEGLFVGEQAWFHLHWAPQPHLLDCAASHAMTSAFCDYEMAWALQSDADVRQ